MSLVAVSITLYNVGLCVFRGGGVLFYAFTIKAGVYILYIYLACDTRFICLYEYGNMEV